MQTRRWLDLRSCLLFRILMTMARVTLGASPKTKASLFGPYFVKIHEASILGATDSRPNLLLENFRVLRVEEIPSRRVVAHEAAGFPARVQGLFAGLATLFRNHLFMMLVAKHVKIFRRTGTQSFLFACWMCGEHR